MASPPPPTPSLPAMNPPSAVPLPSRNNSTSQPNSNSSRIKRRKLASSASSHSRVPPSPSSAPTRGSVNTTARKALYDRDGDCCFCCGNEDTGQACHVLPEADFKRFEIWHRAGLLGFNSLADPDNLVSLCANCHEHFDCNSKPAGWVFLPSDLDFFLRWETERGDTLSVPTGYPGTYSIFVFVATSRNLSYALSIGRTRTWGGSPTAALLKAGMSIGQVATGTDPLGVPEELLLQWIKLRSAYQRRCSPPAPAAVLAVAAPGGPGGDTSAARGTEPDVDRPDGAPPGDGDRAGESAMRLPTRNDGRGTMDAVPPPPMPVGMRFDPASPQLVNRSKPVREAWVFGPGMSVDQIVNKLRWCRG